MKLNKLVLKKETISVRNDFSLSRIKGGDWTTWNEIAKYATYYNSHLDPANCVIGFTGSNDSYCACSDTCNTCSKYL